MLPGDKNKQNCFTALYNNDCGRSDILGLFQYLYENTFQKWLHRVNFWCYLSKGVDNAQRRCPQCPR